MRIAKKKKKKKRYDDTKKYCKLKLNGTNSKVKKSSKMKWSGKQLEGPCLDLESDLHKKTMEPEMFIIQETEGA